MIPEYKYQVKDYSIVTPPFKEYIVKPLIRFIPWRIPANIITILSNLCMYFALAIALYSRLDHRINYSLAAFLIFMYAVGDHLDGMQAKRTKTSSALGEFFDHYLDAFNTGILLMITFALYGITNPYLVSFFLLVNYMAHASVFYEQFKTKWLIFEKIGSLEAVLLSSGLLLLSCINPVNNLLRSTLVFHIKVIELIFLSSTIGTIITFIKTLIRARVKEINFYIFCILLMLSTYLCLFYLPQINVCWVITLYSAYYIGSLMLGHLSDGKERLPDFIIPVLLICTVFIQSLYSFQPGRVFYLLLISYVTYVAIVTVYTLRQYWMWINPKEIN